MMLGAPPGNGGGQAFHHAPTLHRAHELIHAPLAPTPRRPRRRQILKREILPRILLRRTKVQCADDLALPPRTLLLRRERFDEREADFYEVGAVVWAGWAVGGFGQRGECVGCGVCICGELARARGAAGQVAAVVRARGGLL